MGRMDSIELAERSVAELWTLRAVVVDILSRKILAEKATLEERLRKISLLHDVEQKRRPYPEVLPKYRNPKNPNETWSGRGKRPLWLTAQLRSGKRLDHFLIQQSA
jgi:DNA-binding protein H-NS